MNSSPSQHQDTRGIPGISRKRPLTREMIRLAASDRELDIKELLSLVVRQELVASVAASQMGDYIMLEKAKIPSTGSLSIIYTQDERLIKSRDVPGAPMSEALAEMLSGILAAPIPMFEHKVAHRRGSMSYSIEAEVGGYYVPVGITLKEDTGSAFPRKSEFKRVLFPDDPFYAMVYSQTYSVAGEVLAIMKSLELMSDMSPYLKLYENLGEEDFDSIRISARLKKLCDEEGFVPELSQLETFGTYGEYHYMQAKWKRFLRGKRKKEPLWSDVFSRVESFITPIWAGLCTGEVYAADWISGAGRYLNV